MSSPSTAFRSSAIAADAVPRRADAGPLESEDRCDTGHPDVTDDENHGLSTAGGESRQGARQGAQLRVLTVCGVIIAVVAILASLFFARAVLMPVTLAVVLAMVLRPVVSRGRRFGLPNAVTATLLFALVIGVFAAAVALLYSPAEEWLKDAPRTLSDVGSRLSELFEPIAQLQEAKAEVDEMTQTPSESTPVAVRLQQPALTNEMLNTTGSFVASAAITLALLYFLLVYGDRFLEKTVEVVPTRRAKREVVGMVREIEQRISIYLGAITLVNLILGVVIGTGLWAIGMPNPLLWGVMAALFNYIPFAGLAAGTLIVGVVALASFENPAHAAMAPLIYLTANGVEANVLTPLMMGRSVNLNPVMILVAVMLGGWLWGIVGIFLSVPLLIVGKIVCESYDPLKPLAVYLET